jgi:hypothetical protein
MYTHFLYPYLPCSMPNFISTISFSDTAGRSTIAPGRWTFLVSPKVAVFLILHRQYLRMYKLMYKPHSKKQLLLLLVYFYYFKSNQSISYENVSPHFHTIDESSIIKTYQPSMSLIRSFKFKSGHVAFCLFHILLWRDQKTLL